MSNFFTIFLIAVSLSMDTFSLSLTYGLLNLSKKDIYELVISVALFHFFMPIIGSIIGTYIMFIIKIDASLLMSIIFLLIALELTISLFKKEEIMIFNNYLSIIVFSFTVSLDSFSTGLGLSAISSNYYYMSTIFMITSGLFTLIGLLLGKKLKDKIGKKSDLIGIIILIILSLKYFINNWSYID